MTLKSSLKQSRDYFPRCDRPFMEDIDSSADEVELVCIYLISKI